MEKEKKALLKIIKDFADKDTEDFFFARRRIKKWEKIVKKASIILTVINSATSLGEIKTSFGTNLHKLHGDRVGQWSVSINDQYRICFYWEKKQAYRVEITDYH